LISICKNETILSLVRTHLIHKQLPFQCGSCLVVFPIEKYLNHMLDLHGKVIDPSSSHIAIKI
jgi:hypothetical protein